MYENLFAVLRRNESVAFFAIEPCFFVFGGNFLSLPKVNFGLDRLRPGIVADGSAPGLRYLCPLNV